MACAASQARWFTIYTVCVATKKTDNSFVKQKIVSLHRTSESPPIGPCLPCRPRLGGTWGEVRAIGMCSGTAIEGSSMPQGCEYAGVPGGTRRRGSLGVLSDREGGSRRRRRDASRESTCAEGGQIGRGEVEGSKEGSSSQSERGMRGGKSHIPRGRVD